MWKQFLIHFYLKKIEQIKDFRSSTEFKKNSFGYIHLKSRQFVLLISFTFPDYPLLPSRTEWTQNSTSFCNSCTAEHPNTNIFDGNLHINISYLSEIVWLSELICFHSKRNDVQTDFVISLIKDSHITY